MPSHRHAIYFIAFLGGVPMRWSAAVAQRLTAICSSSSSAAAASSSQRLRSPHTSRMIVVRCVRSTRCEIVRRPNQHAERLWTGLSGGKCSSGSGTSIQSADTSFYIIYRILERMLPETRHERRKAEDRHWRKVHNTRRNACVIIAKRKVYACVYCRHCEYVL